MRFSRTGIAGVWVIDPDFHEDDRGRFFVHGVLANSPNTEFTLCHFRRIWDSA